MTKPCVGARAQQQQWTHRDRGSLDTRSWKTHNDMHIYSPLWHQRIIRVLFSGKRENMLIQGNKACHSGHKHAAGNTSVSCLPPFRGLLIAKTHTYPAFTYKECFVSTGENQGLHHEESVCDGTCTVQGKVSSEYAVECDMWKVPTGKRHRFKKIDR